ncbi:MAG: hypothetical protein OXR84_10335 [Magnetovibrio sp.]|nr:hypothetical protein [Magnetovibrio sp.]
MVPQSGMRPETAAVPPPNPCIPSMVDELPEIDVAGIEGRIDRSLTAKVRRLIDDHPDRALEVVRAWMAEDYYH